MKHRLGWRGKGRIGLLVSAWTLAVAAPAGAVVAGHDNAHDPGSLYVTAQEVIGAGEYWNSGVTGKGVDVAVIDTGVAPVEGLSGGKVVFGPDVSFESQAENLRHLDTMGHGTAMAGIIAGRDSTAPSTIQKGDDSRFYGVAPGARVVSLKASDAHGQTDVSQVIAAVDWVTQNRNRHGLNIKVLNLSYGTDSEQLYTNDPLAHAVEQAWRAGIVVVVAAGNGGFGSAKLNQPALNPRVIAVGAVDGRGTYDRADDIVPDWSSSGDSARRPDFVAPGRSIASLRVPGSLADEDYPEARVGDRFFRGSGTSQAAAFVSGAAALIVQQRPGISPDQVKALLKRTAQKLPNVTDHVQGAGLIDLKVARSTPTNIVSQNAVPTTGIGSLEASRGTSHVTVDGVALDGERDIFGAPFVSATWALASTAGTSWTGGLFNGNRWAGDALGTGGSWLPATWTSTDWTGTAWSASRWSASRWSASRWSSDDWAASRWSASRWSASRWSASRWSASRWSSVGWGS